RRADLHRAARRQIADGVCAHGVRRRERRGECPSPRRVRQPAERLSEAHRVRALARGRPERHDRLCEGRLAAALSTAAGLLIVISSSFAHDIYAKLINPQASEAKRLAVGRGAIVVALFVAGYFGIDPPGFVAQVVAFAFGLAAASFFPVILLGIFDSRTNREGAIAGMLSGLVFTMGYIVANRFLGMPAWIFGISAEGIGTVGMILNLAVTIIVSRMTAPPPDEIRAIVESVRVPSGAGAAAEH
ncbi:MAG: hypothetical protein HC882_04575, partial [Acidobacteria bacterium]|nr:hypothetical protein [Acidobacteriota bacterium]